MGQAHTRGGHIEDAIAVSIESEATGYAAVLQAAALVATSPIVTREARDDAESFVMAEVERWAEGTGMPGVDDGEPVTQDEAGFGDEGPAD